MKKKNYIILVGLLSIIGVCGVPVKGYTHYDAAYLRSFSEFNHTNENWMENIPDDVKLSQLSIPGTHDTMSNGPGGDIVQTQGLNLSEQLKVGIRFLDIRLRVINNDFVLHHGPIYLKSNFEDVLNIIRKFLQNYSSETIYMRIKQEYSSVDFIEFKNIFDRYINSPMYNNLFYLGKSPNPTLGETRGNIVVMYDHFYPFIGINYNNSNIQDSYKLNTNWDLYDKWLKVKKHLEEANDNNGRDIYINYLSGSTGSFPYFVASGHSSHGTSSPRLATGLTTPVWNNMYPDFPRVNKFLGVSTIAFEGTNILTKNYINDNEFTHVGIIVADFPGYSLIDKIIEINNNIVIN